MKNLIVLGTHFIDENVISEYRKMQNIPGFDAILAIDNTNTKIKFKNRVEDKIFFDTNCKCFFLDQQLHEEMKLPQFFVDGKKNFVKTSLHIGDCRFYYIRKFFPDCDYYWLIEYDVFCNAENYAGFLEKFTDNHSDLLIRDFKKGFRNDNAYYDNIDWIYNDSEKIYSGLFSVVKLSARAVDFLHKKRLKQIELFINCKAKVKQFPFCEIFVPTELVNGGFICEDLNEPHLNFFPNIYFNDDRIFLKPDNHLYHPVKSVSNEIEKLKKYYADLFYCFRKNFLVNLYEKLISISTINIKDLPVSFNESFTSMKIDLSNSNGGGGNSHCRVWFLNEAFYGAIDKLYAAVVFEGEYLEYFKILEKYIDVNKIPQMQILENDTCKMLAYYATTYDNVSQVANTAKILIEMTFTVLQEKIYENN